MKNHVTWVIICSYFRIQRKFPWMKNPFLHTLFSHWYYITHEPPPYYNGPSQAQNYYLVVSNAHERFWLCYMLYIFCLQILWLIISCQQKWQSTFSPIIVISPTTAYRVYAVAEISLQPLLISRISFIDTIAQPFSHSVGACPGLDRDKNSALEFLVQTCPPQSERRYCANSVRWCTVHIIAQALNNITILQISCKRSKTERGIPDCMKATFEVCHPRSGKLSAIWGYLLSVEGDG